MAFKGMRQIKDAVDQTKKDFGGGGWMRYFSLGDKESADVIFLGTEDTEPSMSREHSIKTKSGKFSSIQHREDDCVPCYQNTAGDRTVGRPSVKARFTMFDLRWSKKKKDPERSEKEGKERFAYTPLDEKDVTAKGIARGIHVRRGKCGWRMPSQWAQALEAADALAGRRCKSCGKGKISVAGYKGAKTRGLDDEEIQDLIDSGKLRPVLECSKCDEPVRTSIFNSVVTITRSGLNTSTTYQFAVGTDDPPELGENGMPDELPEAYDWDAVDGEPSPAAQAQALGVKNPFGKGKGAKDATSYDDEDDDDFDDEDDDDEKPVKGRGKPAPVNGKKARKDPFEDDDEDDEDDEDDDADEDDGDGDDDDDEPVRKKAPAKRAMKRRVKVAVKRKKR